MLVDKHGNLVSIDPWKDSSDWGRLFLHAACRIWLLTHRGDMGILRSVGGISLTLCALHFSLASGHPLAVGRFGGVPLLDQRQASVDVGLVNQGHLLNLRMDFQMQQCITAGLHRWPQSDNAIVILQPRRMNGRTP